MPALSIPTVFSRLAALACLATALGASAAQVDVAGVKLEDQLDLRGTSLQLNGAGVRYKAIFKVYTAGFYVGKKVATPEEALAAPGPKRMAITMLRDIDANELGKLFTKGVEDNSPKSEMVNLIPGLLRMGQMFADQKQLKTGDTFTIDWLQGTGTLITVRGVPQPDPVKEPAFFNALMRIWLGPNPADWKLKEALLGAKP
ncbi:chalcone isomerase family protein [Variovorax boronicumulans]|uniref:chalcone isomerase family protein n=1 Tax=Variovorax boronicumulans TaxID=436515 RepID=UPI0033973BB9